jgi:DNA (cytosine-5)-methyltransferase 1
MSLTYTDIFCGAGGSSIGLTEAGFELKLAANHWARAIETHSANFSDAEHLCADVSNYDMRRLPRTDILWASPICTEISPAGGRKRKSRQLELEVDGHVPLAAMDRTRATFWDVLRAVEVHRYKAVLIENVVEAADWELFDIWLAGMTTLGYAHQFVSVSSAHVGGEDNPYAPQWRDRLYIVFTAKGVPLPDVRPRPLAWCFACGELVNAMQSWKKPDRRPIGKYGQQYVYVCPNGGKCRHAAVEPFVLPAAAAIDWSDIGTRIGDRARPLAAATIRRIEAGLRMFGQPVDVQVGGNTFEREGYTRAWPVMDAPVNARTGTPGDALACPPMLVPAGGTWNTTPTAVDEPMRTRLANEKGYESLVCSPFMVYGYSGGVERRVKPVDEPLGTVVANGRGHHGLCTPFAVNVNHGGDDGRPYPVDNAPLAPRTTKIGDAVVAPFMAMLRNNQTAAGVDVPLSTVSAGGRHHGLTVPASAFLQKHHGGVNYARIEHMTKSIDDPMPSIVARPNVSLVVPYRRGAKPYRAVDNALSTVATKEQHGLMRPAVEVDDCHFRMLAPREHLRAQRFPDSYIVTGNKGEQTMMAGNAVSANVAHWLGKAISAVL